MKKLLMVMAAGFMLTAASPTAVFAAEASENNAPYCYEHGEGCWGNHGRWSNEDGSDRGDRGGYHGGCRGGYGGGHHRGNW